MLIDERWVYGVHTFDAEGLSEKEIKVKIFSLDKNGYKAHILQRDRKKTLRVISAPQKGAYLVGGVQQHLSSLEYIDDLRANNWIYAESNGDKSFFIIVKDGVVLFDKIVDEDDYESIYVATTIEAEAKNENCTIVLADTFKLEEYLEKVDANDVASRAELIREKSKIITPFISTIKPSEKKHEKFVNTINVQFKKNFDKRPLLVFGALILSLAAYLFQPEDEKPTEPVVVVNPYEKFHKVVTQTAANVKVRMSYLFNDITGLDKLISWEVVKIELKPNDTILYLDSHNQGSYKELEKFSYDLNYNISKIKNNYVLLGRIKHSPVLREAVLVPADGVLRYIEEAIGDWVNGALVDKVSNPISNGKWQEVAFSIKLQKGLYKHDFDTLGTIFNGLPVAFKSGTLIYNSKEQNFSGSLEFILYGGV